MGAGADLQAARAVRARVQLGLGPIVAEQGLRQGQGEGALADALGADEEEGVREPALRQRCSRLVRKTLSFSKKLANHIGALWYFIHDYNARRGAKLVITTSA